MSRDDDEVLPDELEEPDEASLLDIDLDAGDLDEDLDDAEIEADFDPTSAEAEI